MGSDTNALLLPLMLELGSYFKDILIKRLTCCPPVLQAIYCRLRFQETFRIPKCDSTYQYKARLQYWKVLLTYSFYFFNSYLILSLP